MSDDPNIEAWIDQARSADILEIATLMGAVLKRSGSEWVGPCPLCNGTDRFAVKPSEQVFNCRGSVGGDVIKLVEHVREVEFMAACEIIIGEPPPRRESQVKPVDPEIARERREERRDQELARAEVEAKKQERGADRAARIFNDSTPIAGTQADAYLRRRCIFLTPEMSSDLRFAAGLEYRGYADADANEETALGVFPCMVAAIRNAVGEIIGIHRTYLDPVEPVKLRPPGDAKQNKAKKSFGTVMGGAIRLGPVRRIMAIGEGIETCASWYQLDYGPDDIGIMSAVSLGNLSGAATATVRHPNGKGTIPNGIPDLARPGIILPDGVEEVILLGDGDSEPIATRARLLTAASRFRTQGLTVSLQLVLAKADFNDVLLERKRAA
ncbi:CHC2 zinc finger domain-containing protein [Bosea sp. 2YAB26]|uniref:DUF7146 domain-containing protein n=1 Tax=Bosea sp. 2YAB26 TaxID=3237478 RepID=UPI003F935B31